ncbi:MAG: copper amine oxidase N-terminal domain-containing protein [Candidatus Eremiobacteraeota bacterium]|nr:copper amine oxidase N-terminal domain-containing protein [Candidatus Eremiobacteraeota bacterium]
MKRLSTGLLGLLFAASLGVNAVAAQSSPASHGNIGTNAIAQASAMPAATAAPAMAMPAANFGAPPSGQIPILFNDHHVYSKPDKLKQGRVLAALVRGGTILIPLRSMFEQMGATVSYDPGSRTVDVSKPGSDVKVTVGKAEVSINGETRPLDVPPEIYQGHVVVPVRVISEGMGAYVQWVPEKKLVVVRYAPATPAPPPTAAPATAAPATPAPTPEPTKTPYADKFIVGDYILNPKVYNEFSPGNTSSGNKDGFSYNVRGAIELPLMGLPFMLEGDYRQYNYPHNQTLPTPLQGPGTVICKSPPAPLPLAPPGVILTAGGGDQGCVTAIGGAGQTFVPAFTARDYDFDARAGIKVLDPRVYVGVGYMYRTGNYGYPKLSGLGVGLEKLPDLDQPFSIYGSAWYYPNVRGTCGVGTCPTGPYTLAYNILKYQVGGTFNFGASPLFLDFGYLGDRMKNKSNAPSDATHNGAYIGLGLHF